MNDYLSIHGNTVVFGSATASSSIALTLNFPVRDSNSQEIVVSPFFGGGIQFRKEESTYISTLAVGGVDIPINKSLTVLSEYKQHSQIREKLMLAKLRGLAIAFSFF
ncbi:MAG: hypothetical protein LH631_11895 [Alkalinema sp. CAN_BIN05]|nr:hypothetical protein [Alkalinema sp. CAN_BIN05]